MVELTQECVEGKHAFTRQFPNPVDWALINAAIHDPAPRCPEHPEYPNCSWDEWEKHMISIDEIADFTLRCHKTLESAAARIKELETENKILKEALAPKAPSKE